MIFFSFIGLQYFFSADAGKLRQEFWESENIGRLMSKAGHFEYNLISKFKNLIQMLNNKQLTLMV